MKSPNSPDPGHSLSAGILPHRIVWRDIPALASHSNHFTVQANGHADLIAGTNILLKPGTSVELHGSLHARISNDWCTQQPNPLASFEEEPIAVYPDYNTEPGAAFFKAYPNPTTGDFTLELNATDENAALLVAVYGLRGELVLRIELPAGKAIHKFSLEDQLPGVYIVRLLTTDRTGALRLIKM